MNLVDGGGGPLVHHHVLTEVEGAGLAGVPRLKAR